MNTSIRKYVYWLIACVAIIAFSSIMGYLVKRDFGVGFPQWSGMWPLILQVYIPVFAFLLFLLTWFFRRTGRIYLGALMISSLWIWWLAAGPVSQNSGRVRNGSAFLFQNDVVHPFCLPRWPKKSFLVLSPSHIGTFF